MRPHDRTRARKGCGAVDQSLRSFRPGRLAGDPDRAFRCHRRRAGGALDSQLGLSDLRGRTAPAAVSTRVVSVSRPRRAQPLPGGELRGAGAKPHGPLLRVGSQSDAHLRRMARLRRVRTRHRFDVPLVEHAAHPERTRNPRHARCHQGRPLPASLRREPRAAGTETNRQHPERISERRAPLVHCPGQLGTFHDGIAQAFAGHLSVCAGFSHRVAQRLHRAGAARRGPPHGEVDRLCEPGRRPRESDEARARDVEAAPARARPRHRRGRLPRARAGRATASQRRIGAFVVTTRAGARQQRRGGDRELGATRPGRSCGAGCGGRLPRRCGHEGRQGRIRAGDGMGNAQRGRRVPAPRCQARVREFDECRRSRGPRDRCPRHRAIALRTAPGSSRRLHADQVSRRADGARRHA